MGMLPDTEEFLENPMSLVYSIIGIGILIFIGLLVGGSFLASFIQTFFNPIILIITLASSYIAFKKPNVFLPIVLIVTFLIWGYGIYLQLSNPPWYCQIPIISWLCTGFSLLPWLFDLVVKFAVIFVQIHLFTFVLKEALD